MASSSSTPPMPSAPDHAEHHGRRPQRRHRDDRVGRQGRDRRGHPRAIEFAHGEIKKIVAASMSWSKAGKPKRKLSPRPSSTRPTTTGAQGQGRRPSEGCAGHQDARQDESYALVKQIKDELAAASARGRSRREEEAQRTYYELLRERIFREQVTKERIRPDRRAFDEIRAITIETSVLPRTHGSALFTRGETQALVTATLGTADDGSGWRATKASRRRTSCSTTTFRRSALVKRAV
jgi:polyribonucleotide nucleotidyltransferase